MSAACAMRTTATNAPNVSSVSAGSGGEAPPGWRRNGRTAEKDPAQWNGADLTDEARAAYRTFLAAVPVVQHRNFPITVDEIAGSAPPLARKGLGGTRP